MNQDILNLYKKAHNGGLNAQEVFWLEGQAATHPCFGMAYMILARHHYRNQSTIKNKALLKAAAYANNRTLLRRYLEDTLTPPQPKPVPVSEMRPILEKKAPEESTTTISLAKIEAPEPPTAPAVDGEVTAASAEIEVNAVAETPEIAAELPETDTPVAPIVAEIAAEPVVAEADAEPIVAEIAAEPVVAEADVEPIVTEIAAEPVVAEADAEPIVAEIVAEPVVAEADAKPIVAEIVAEPIVAEADAEPIVDEIAAEPVVAEADAEPIVAEIEAELPIAEPVAAISDTPVAYIGKPGDINWFLNMRIKLRSEKHRGTAQRITDGIARFAPKLTVVAENSSAEAATEADPVIQNATLTPAEAAQQAATVVAPTVVEAAIEVIAPSADVANPVDVLAAPVIAAIETPEPSIVAAESGGDAVATEARKQPDAPATAQEQAEAAPEKQYEIGSFSSFTFLSEGESEETGEEMDTHIATLDAVEFKTGEGESGVGEIVFEENDRIIEISVSAEALQKYFKGRLPSEPAHTFGEFKIELDEHEYHAVEHEVVAPVEQAVVEPIAAEEDSASSAFEGLSFELSPAQEDDFIDDHREKVEAIIDRFIENEPGITRARVTGVPSGDLAKGSNHFQDDEWVTETLAKIYEKQGNKSKAIKIYEKLRLRMPEKNDYFVSLIENLKH